MFYFSSGAKFRCLILFYIFQRKDQHEIDTKKKRFLRVPQKVIGEGMVCAELLTVGTGHLPVIIQMNTQSRSQLFWHPRTLCVVWRIIDVITIVALRIRVLILI